MEITLYFLLDFEKAFDRVNWEKMMKVLQSICVDLRDRRMISELYQEAVVRIAGGESDSDIIRRGVRQGCPLSPLLFSNICRDDDEGSLRECGRGNKGWW